MSSCRSFLGVTLILYSSEQRFTYFALSPSIRLKSPHGVACVVNCDFTAALVYMEQNTSHWTVPGLSYGDSIASWPLHGAHRGNYPPIFVQSGCKWADAHLYGTRHVAALFQLPITISLHQTSHVTHIPFPPNSGPVWVYVLERRRAVEVWNALMGDSDPEVARQISPNSLRALYGATPKDNAIAGSPDVATAEEQINCLFQSSPPFSSTDLPPEMDTHGNGEFFNGDRSFDSGYTQHHDEDDDDSHHPLSPRRWAEGVENPLSPSTSSTAQQSQTHYGSETRSQKSSGASGGSRSDGGSKSGGKALFRARPLPKTTHMPDSQPRMTRAAALRAGARPVEPPLHNKPRQTPTRDEVKRVFMDVPGHKRSSTITVASTAPPTVAPRMTRAAALRIGQPVEKSPSPKRRPLSMLPQKERDAIIFDGVPGHKRRESIPVASVQAPTVSPRLNKSAELRAKKESLPPPSSYQCKFFGLRRDVQTRV